MALIRKAQAGSDSHGHVWPEDGSVVEIDDPEQIASLMAIPDAGFSEVTPRGKAEAAPAASEEDDGDAGALIDADEIAEVDPQDEDVEAPKPAAKKTAARKTTAAKPE